MSASTTREAGADVMAIRSRQVFLVGWCWFASAGSALFLCSGDREGETVSRNGFNVPAEERFVAACCLRLAAFELGDGALTSRDASTRLLLGDVTSMAEERGIEGRTRASRAIGEETQLC